MSRRKAALVRRVRRKMWGGRYDMRIFADGSMHVRFDHPSNDPEIEMAMAGASIKIARRIFADHGLGEPVIGPMAWRSDPEPTR